MLADELVDDVSVSEPHAASVMTSDAAHATTATEEGIRSEFTVVTVQPHGRASDARPAMESAVRRLDDHGIFHIANDLATWSREHVDLITRTGAIGMEASCARIHAQRHPPHSRNVG
ncbi:hypothetical protein AU195_16740 [Mycobacterium sp. IS-1496]|nr:hypothetical protein [Mycobacterium sp. IS-1496]KUI36912.1 hypothetical protein AU195_16740 [Mycobacterium sp. IS-1496]